MNGPEHYRRAEQLEGEARVGGYESSDAAELLAAAQVHATLALAAAQAAQVRHEDVDPGTWQGWRDVIGDRTAHPVLAEGDDGEFDEDYEAGWEERTPTHLNHKAADGAEWDLYLLGDTPGETCTPGWYLLGPESFGKTALVATRRHVALKAARFLIDHWPNGGAS